MHSAVFFLLWYPLPGLFAFWNTAVPPVPLHAPGSENRSADMSGLIFFEKIFQIGNYPSYLVLGFSQSQRKEVIDRDGKRAPR